MWFRTAAMLIKGHIWVCMLVAGWDTLIPLAWVPGDVAPSVAVVLWSGRSLLVVRTSVCVRRVSQSDSSSDRLWGIKMDSRAHMTRKTCRLILVYFWDSSATPVIIRLTFWKALMCFLWSVRDGRRWNMWRQNVSAALCFALWFGIRQKCPQLTLTLRRPRRRRCVPIKEKEKEKLW